MKCPKCGYLGFERVERCRNCGYDFLRSAAPRLPDLSMRASTNDIVNPLADLALIDAAFSQASDAADAFKDFLPEVQRPAPGDLGPTPELPLFGSPAVDDAPLITKPSAPRTPLAVRRATPDVPRLRTEARATMFDIAQADSEPVPNTVRAPALNLAVRPAAEDTPIADRASDSTAPISARVTAAAIDVALLLAIDAAVVYFTMQICGLKMSEISMIPKAPLATFLILQNASYFVAFTARGQTLGQLARGIKVVSTDGDESPDLGHAVLRTLVWALLAIPAGLGLLTALFSADGRGLHDRCAGTRVVSAGT